MTTEQRDKIKKLAEEMFPFSSRYFFEFEIDYASCISKMKDKRAIFIAGAEAFEAMKNESKQNNN